MLVNFPKDSVSLGLDVEGRVVVPCTTGALLVNEDPDWNPDDPCYANDAFDHGLGGH
jgi:hypothetical protein